MAQVDYFLKLDGIDGEATDDKHKGSIDLQSWSWGETNSGATGMTGAGRGSGKVSMQDFHFVMSANAASPKLMAACANGSHIKSATLTCRKAGEGQQEYMIVKMSDLLVSSYQTGGSEGGAPTPTDQISLNFSKIEFEYKPQKADGSLGAPVKAGYDVALNKKV